MLHTPAYIELYSQIDRFARPPPQSHTFKGEVRLIPFFADLIARAILTNSVELKSRKGPWR